MSPVKMSKIESAVRVVLAFNDALNRHDVDVMMALMSADCVFENTSPAPDGAIYRGQAAVAAFWREFFAQAPQAKITVEDIFGMGRRCIMLWRYDWGEGHVRGVDVYRVENDLIEEKLSYVKG